MSFYLAIIGIESVINVVFCHSSHASRSSRVTFLHFRPQILLSHGARMQIPSTKLVFGLYYSMCVRVLKRRCQNMGPAVDKVSRERLHQSLSRAENSLFFIAARAIWYLNKFRGRRRCEMTWVRERAMWSIRSCSDFWTHQIA